MNMQDGAYSPEHNEGLLTPEYLHALAQEVNLGAKKSEIIYNTTENPQPSIEQKVEALMQAQMVSIAKNAEITNKLYDFRLQNERARYIEKHKKGILVGRVIGYIFDDLLKFPTNESRPAVTLMDVQRQAGYIGGQILYSDMGEKNYFWYNPEATMSKHKGEYVFMQMRGDQVTSHIRYPIAYEPTTGESHVSKIISNDLTSTETSAKIDLIPNQHTELDREELQDLAATVDTTTSLLASTWDINLPELSVDPQAVGQVYHYQNDQLQNPVSVRASMQQPGQIYDLKQPDNQANVQNVEYLQEVA